MSTDVDVKMEPVEESKQQTAAASSSNGASASSSSAPAAASSSSSSSSVAIHGKTFWNRMHTIYESWKKGQKPWGAAPPPGASAGAPPTGPAVDSIVLIYGPANEDGDEYDRTLAIHNYLFGYEFADTAIAFCRDPDTCVIITSAKKCKILEAIGKDDRPVPIKLQTYVSNKADKNAANIANFINKLKASKSGKRCGTIPDKGERAASALTSALTSALKKSGIEIGIDVSAGFSGVLAIKDNAAKECIQKAADYSAKVLKKFVVKHMEEIIDEEKKVSQSDLADQVEDAIKDPSKVDPKIQLKPEDLDSCYSPIIQSGSLDDKFDLKPSASSSNNPLAYDPATTIIIQLGARYKQLCSNIGRTYFINPVDEQKQVYHVLTDVYMACKKTLRHGVKVAAVYAAAVKAIQDAKRSDLLPKFTKSCGFGMGFEFREGALILNDKNTKTLVKGMVFNLCVGFQDLVTRATKATGDVARPYAVLIADTVVVGDKEDAEAWTRLPREYKDVSYHLGDEQPDESAVDDSEAVVREIAAQERRTTRGVGKDALRSEQDESEAKRTAHQKELARKKQEDALRRYAAGGVDESSSSSSSFDLSQLHVYKSVNEYPAALRHNHVHVDINGDCVLFPINDQMVPFHISTIQRPYKSDENGFTYLRVKFIVPDTAAARAKMKVQKGAQYISELVYRTSTTSLDRPYFEIEQMRKHWLSRVKEQEVKQSLVEQEELRLDRVGPPPILKDISVRPHLSRKKTTGTLTAHVNGLRFVTTDKIKVDIIYANIQSAFYQPAEEGNHNVTIHFELKNPILIDKSKTKKTNHLQFFVEVVESSEDLATSSRFRDEDGLAEEQEERRRKKKWNERFLQFVKEVEEKLSKDPKQPKLEFDIPYKELGFTGVPSKQQVQIMPTVHSLVALDDNPPMVVNLNDVEVANFERIQFGLKNFDLVFVWKDFKRLPMRIEAIPIKSFEPIKHWLNSCDIVFYESAQNILWKTVMKQINDDVEGFWQDGGFDIFLSHNAEDDNSDYDEEEEEEEEEAAPEEGADGAAASEGGEKSSKKPAAKKSKKKAKDEESESDFEPESGESGSDSEEYDTPSEEDDDEDDDGEGGSGSDGDSEEEALDWDELDEKAKKADKEKALKNRMKGGSDADSGSDSDGERRPAKKAKPSSGPARPIAKPSSSSARPASSSSKPAPKSGAAPARPATSGARPTSSIAGKPIAKSGGAPIRK